MNKLDDFDSKYDHDHSVKSEHFDDGRLETFGKDLETLETIDKNKVWTMLDVEGKLCLAAGIHHVNRLYYVVTEQSWKSSDEYYEE